MNGFLVQLDDQNTSHGYSVTSGYKSSLGIGINGIFESSVILAGTRVTSAPGRTLKLIKSTSLTFN